MRLDHLAFINTDRVDERPYPLQGTVILEELLSSPTKLDYVDLSTEDFAPGACAEFTFY